jgi:hypothetical protein
MGMTLAALVVLTVGVTNVPVSILHLLFPVCNCCLDGKVVLARE